MLVIVRVIVVMRMIVIVRMIVVVRVIVIVRVVVVVIVRLRLRLLHPRQRHAATLRHDPQQTTDLIPEQAMRPRERLRLGVLPRAVEVPR